MGITGVFGGLILPIAGGILVPYTNKPSGEGFRGNRRTAKRHQTEVGRLWIRDRR